ncbi:MAG: MoaD/ThiS family protein [Syntrophobacterales bacterium]|nr:MoaD/ThiS family protein [Syntrophobacterales bacterium]
MPLNVFLAATLRRFIPDYNPEKGITLEVGPGVSVSHVADILGIPKDEIKIVMINGIHASIDHILKGDERVAFFPAVGGG